MMYALKFRHPHPVIPDAWAPFVFAKVRDAFRNVDPIEATTNLHEAALESEIEVLQRSVTLLSAVADRGKNPDLIEMFIVEIDGMQEVEGSDRKIG